MSLRSRVNSYWCQVDRLLVSSFVPPFVLSFSIALFVLIMQFLWRFIDDIIGKGVGALVVMEMFFYKSISLFPLAFPIAVLLASVMVLGNLAERYELSSFKSAGVPLTRILQPLFLFCILVAGFSFYCSNTIIPIANLKYQSRLYDIRNKKPTLSIEPGVFNEDFKGYAIRVGQKDRDNESIEDIMVYDDTQRNKGELNLVTARRGRMYVSPDDGAFVMTLYDGYQYAETKMQGRGDGLPFSITHFAEWTRRFDLGEFDLDRTEEEQWKSHQMMKSARQIAIEIDTLDAQIRQNRVLGLTPYALWGDTAAATGLLEEVGAQAAIDSARLKRVLEARDAQGLPTVSTATSIAAGRAPSAVSPRPGITRATPERSKYVAKTQVLHTFLDTLATSTASSLVEALPQVLRREYKAPLSSRVSTTQTAADRNQRTLHRLELTRRKHVYELHWKFSLAAACIVMLLIGGPMGTIVRKGGFGYPLLVSIFFFTFFIMSNISCKKLNDSENLPPVIAAWLPVFLLSLVAVLLTRQALNDSKWAVPDRLKMLWGWLIIRKAQA